MINTVYNILKPLGYPVAWLTRPKLTQSNIVISYHFFNEKYAFYGDGNPGEKGGSLQVDVFSKIDYSDAIFRIKEELKNNKFKFDWSDDTIEGLNTTEQLYHKVMIFQYIEEEVR